MLVQSLPLTTYARLRFCQSIYTRHLDLNLHSAGFRIYEEHECHSSGLHLAFFCPVWFPDAHADAAFRWADVQGEHIHLGFVFRGTGAQAACSGLLQQPASAAGGAHRLRLPPPSALVAPLPGRRRLHTCLDRSRAPASHTADPDHLGNLRSDFELLYAKFADAAALPDVAHHASCLVLEQLQALLDAHPRLKVRARPAAACAGGAVPGCCWACGRCWGCWRQLLPRWRSLAARAAS
jgi:hypothetical protein